MILSDVCLSVAYIGNNSRTERPRKNTLLAQRLPKSHVTLAPLSRSKGQRSRSPGRFTHRVLNASGSCGGERGNVLGVGNYWYVAVCMAALYASAPTEGERRRYIVAAARLLLLYIYTIHCAAASAKCNQP